MAVGTFDIDDLDDRLRDPLDADVAARFEHHRVAAPQQRIHERIHFFLFQWLATCDFDQPGRMARHGRQNILERHFLAARVGILRVTVDASQ